MVSEYNKLGDGRYFDVESQSSFAFDHATQKASGVQSYVLDSNHADLVYVYIKVSFMEDMEAMFKALLLIRD